MHQTSGADVTRGYQCSPYDIYSQTGTLMQVFAADTMNNLGVWKKREKTGENMLAKWGIKMFRLIHLQVQSTRKTPSSALFAAMRNPTHIYSINK